MAAQLERDLDAGRGGMPYFESDDRPARPSAGRPRCDDRGGARELALTSSTTESCNIAVAGLRLGPDDEVVTTDTEHFGLLGPLRASGAAIRIAEVRARPPEEALDAILAQMTPKTRLLALSHVSWQTGNLLPVEELREATDVPILVDGAQSQARSPSTPLPTTSTRCPGRSGSAGPTRRERCTSVTRKRSPSRSRPTSRRRSTRRTGSTCPAPAPHGSTAAGCDLVPRWARGRARDRPALGTAPFTRHRRSLLGASVRALRGRHRTRPGDARLVRPPGRPRRRRGRALRAGRCHPGHAWHRLAARLVRLVDERRRSRPAAGRPLASSSDGPARPISEG